MTRQQTLTTSVFLAAVALVVLTVWVDADGSVEKAGGDGDPARGGNDIPLSVAISAGDSPVNSTGRSELSDLQVFNDLGRTCEIELFVYDGIGEYKAGVGFARLVCLWGEGPHTQSQAITVGTDGRGSVRLPIGIPIEFRATHEDKSGVRRLDDLEPFCEDGLVEIRLNPGKATIRFQLFLAGESDGAGLLALVRSTPYKGQLAQSSRARKVDAFSPDARSGLLAAEVDVLVPRPLYWATANSEGLVLESGKVEPPLVRGEQRTIDVFLSDAHGDIEVTIRPRLAPGYDWDEVSQVRCFLISETGHIVRTLLVRPEQEFVLRLVTGHLYHLVFWGKSIAPANHAIDLRGAATFDRSLSVEWYPTGAIEFNATELGLSELATPADVLLHSSELGFVFPASSVDLSGADMTTVSESIGDLIDAVSIGGRMFDLHVGAAETVRLSPSHAIRSVVSARESDVYVDSAEVNGGRVIFLVYIENKLWSVTRSEASYGGIGFRTSLLLPEGDIRIDVIGESGPVGSFPLSHELGNPVRLSP